MNLAKHFHALLVASVLGVLYTALVCAADPSAGANLEIPQDLAPKTREALQQAIASFQSAEKAQSGQQKMLADAVKKLEAAGRKATQSALPHYYLGIAHQITKDFKKARTALEKAISLNPSFHEAIMELADVHVWEKDVAGSIAVYDKALAVEAKNPDALERKANALIQLTRYDEAKETLLKANKAQASSTRAMMLVQLEQVLKGPGWETTYVDETENYKVSTPVSKEFAHEIAIHAELIRSAYQTIFPDVSRPDRKYPIWVYADKDAYHKAGAPPQAGGHYSPLFQMLVLPRYPKKEDTYLVLNHEAFHQYLHEYLELAPQWFNEGLGDYFGPFVYMRKGTKDFLVSRPNPWRLEYIQQAIRERACPAVADLMLMTREQMYSGRAGLHYAQAWSLIYFMLEGRKPAYRDALVKYFLDLRRGGNLNTAYQKTFGRIDMATFEKEWQHFIANLKTRP